MNDQLKIFITRIKRCVVVSRTCFFNFVIWHILKFKSVRLIVCCIFFIWMLLKTNYSFSAQLRITNNTQAMQYECRMKRREIMFFSYVCTILHSAVFVCLESRVYVGIDVQVWLLLINDECTSEILKSSLDPHSYSIYSTYSMLCNYHRLVYLICCQRSAQPKAL